MEQISNESILEGIQYILFQYSSKKHDIEKLRKLMIDKIVEISGSKYGYFVKSIYDNDVIIGQQLKTFSTNTYKDAPDDFLKLFPLDTASLKNYIFENMEATYSRSLKTGEIYISDDITKDQYGCGARDVLKNDYDLV